jgi:hypothetical protein
MLLLMMILTLLAVLPASVMDVIMADKMDQALLKAAVGLLKRCEQRLLDVKDMEDCLALLKEELPSRLPHPLSCQPSVLSWMPWL